MEATLEEMDRVIDINIRGVFATTQAALKQNHFELKGQTLYVGHPFYEKMRHRTDQAEGARRP